MAAAYNEATLAIDHNEVPVGAVIVYNSKIIARSHNLSFSTSDPTAHAEINVIRHAAKILGMSRLNSCNLYVTLEPCPMCAQAISFARIARLYFGAYDSKGGGIENGPKIFNQSTCFHRPEVYGGIMEEECGQLLKRFFQSKR